MALSLHETAVTLLSEDEISYVHTFVDMSAVEVSPAFSGRNETVTTCIGALGDAMAAGEEEGDVVVVGSGRGRRGSCFCDVMLCGINVM